MRRFISVVLLLASLVMGLSCRQQEPRFPQLGVRPAAPRQQQPYESVPLAAFGPAVKALPESMGRCTEAPEYAAGGLRAVRLRIVGVPIGIRQIDRKSTRLNSSHSQISYAVFCLKKKKK